jgi:hypothetical protein
MAANSLSETLNPMPLSCPSALSSSVDGDRGVPVARADVRFVTLAAATIGFFVAARFEKWIIALEAGQFLSGLVKYPSHNSYSIYNMSIITAINQLVAAFLWAGVPERVLNFWFNGFCGAFSAVALSLWTLALGRDRYIALIPPLVLLPFAGKLPLNLNYPAALLPDSHSVYSMFSVTVGILAVGLLGLGRLRTGLLLIGFGPAFHPSGGLWVLGIAILAMVWGWEQTQARFVPYWRYLVLGLVLSVSIWGVHRMLTSPVPKLPNEQASQYVNAFVQRWDDHRVPPSAKTFLRVALVAMSGIAVCALWLGRFRTDLSSNSLFLLRAYVLAAGIGLVLGLGTLWMDALPEIFQRVIPGRYINFALIAHVPLIVGLLAATRQAPAALVVLAYFAVAQALLCQFRIEYLFVGSATGCAIARWSLVYQQDSDQAAWSAAKDLPTWSSILLVVIAMSGFSRSFLLLSAAFLPAEYLWRTGRWPAAWPVSVRYATAALLGLTMLVATGGAIRKMVQSYGELQDWTNNAFCRAAHDGSGMIMSSGDMLKLPIQLCTRRPVVLPRDINFIPYFPEGAPDMDRVLRAFFGFGLADPPPEIQHNGVVPGDVGRAVWENRSPEEWQRLAEEFRVSGVITPDQWKLKLPVIAEDFHLTLYGIPGTKQAQQAGGKVPG